jgi:hypothetical protein
MKVIVAIVASLMTACSGTDKNAASDASQSDAKADARAIDGSSCPAAPNPDIGATTKLAIAGSVNDPDGIFDPSVVYPSGASAGFLAYSSVQGKLVHSKLAASNDAGATWSFFSEVNTTSAVSITTSDNGVCGGPTCNGTLVHETPGLLVDPTDPDSSRLFKVFSHSYFLSASQNIHYTLGNLTMYTAAVPQGPWTEHKILGWNSSSTVSSLGVGQNITTDAALAGLADCVLLTEPSAVVDGTGAISLAVGCARILSPSDVPIDIRLLRSTDHGSTWRYVATMLSVADAIAIGAPKHQINGASFYQKNDKLFLYASPDGPVDLGSGVVFSGYRGCISVAVTDLATGTIARCDGKPVIMSSIPGASNEFLGACAYAEGASALGVTGDKFGTPTFTIFATHRSP